MSDYLNYKGCYSVMFLALVDGDYCFSYIDTGCNRRASDGGIFAQSSLEQALQRNALDLPENSMIVGDAAFPLKMYPMKPYLITPKYKEKIFNYHLSRSRKS